jgi:hypothetical protein
MTFLSWFLSSFFSRRIVALAFSASLAASTLAPGCALRPPVQNSGPAVSQEGVRLAVTGQTCGESEEPERHGENLAQATVEVQVRNDGATPLTVHPDAFRLVTAQPGRVYLKTMTRAASDPLTIAGGATLTFQLRFMNRGSLRCASPLTLDAGAAVTAGDRPVKVGAVSFQPTRG